MRPREEVESPSFAKIHRTLEINRTMASLPHTVRTKKSLPISDTGILRGMPSRRVLNPRDITRQHRTPSPIYVGPIYPTSEADIPKRQRSPPRETEFEKQFRLRRERAAASDLSSAPSDTPAPSTHYLGRTPAPPLSNESLGMQRRKAEGEADSTTHLPTIIRKGREEAEQTLRATAAHIAELENSPRTPSPTMYDKEAEAELAILEEELKNANKQRNTSAALGLHKLASAIDKRRTAPRRAAALTQLQVDQGARDRMGALIEDAQRQDARLRMDSAKREEQRLKADRLQEERRQEEKREARRQEEEARQTSALKLQSHVRGRQEEKREARRQEEEARQTSALKLQSHVRGRQEEKREARRQEERRQEERRQEERRQEEKREARRQEEREARRQEEREARRQEEREARRQEERRQEEEARQTSALKLQSHVRGRQGRNIAQLNYIRNAKLRTKKSSAREIPLSCNHSLEAACPDQRRRS